MHWPRHAGTHGTPGNTHGSSCRSRGFTLAELLIAITLFGLVIAMIGIPLISGLGFVKKINARSDTQRIGARTLQQVANELEQASYVYDLPPDGSWVSYLPQNSATQTGGTTTQLMRLGHLPSFPWTKNGAVSAALAASTGTTISVDSTAALWKGMKISPDNNNDGLPDGGFATVTDIDAATNTVTVNSGISVNAGANLLEGWSLAKPDYLKFPPFPQPPANTGYLRSYADLYSPFFEPGGGDNPYILGRMSRTLPWTEINEVSAAIPVPRPYDGMYPMNTAPYVDLTEKAAAHATLQRKYRNDYTAYTPADEGWDVPTFKVTPKRVMKETLPLLTKAQPDGTTVVATTAVGRYPWWAGRNMDMDDLKGNDAEIGKLFLRELGTATTSNVFNLTSAQLENQVVNAAWATNIIGSAPAENWWLFTDDKSRPVWWQFYPVGINPYGYQIRVFDKDGSLVYGIDQSNSMVLKRHFMEWPPIDRRDWFPGNATDPPMWTPADIARQRLEGKIVFAQKVYPYTHNFRVNNSILSYTNYVSLTEYSLPIPFGWSNTDTRLVSPPQQLRFTRTDQAGYKVFTLVNKDKTKLLDGEFCITDYQTRKYALGVANGILSGTWEIDEADARKCAYLVSDLQPTDIVEATYSTRSVLNVALTTSRQDSTVKKGQTLRQDFKGNTTVAVRTAARGAKSE